MHDFAFLRPATLEAAVEALRAEGAQPLAGGQTLIPAMKQRLAAPAVLVSLTGIAALRGIAATPEGLRIGAACTHAEVARGAAAPFPALAALAAQIGDPAVRNRGTMGGSLANNDPAACYPAAVLATGARIATDRREIAAQDYFRGLFATALEEGEIVTAVTFPIPARAVYVKFPQPASRFALVGVFVAQGEAGVRVAVTGAAEDGVFRWHAAEQALGRDFSPAALEGLALPAEGMTGDLHGSPAYRAHLVAVLTRRAVALA